jgi:replicative DNA helicase
MNQDFGRRLPFSLEAEQSVLGSVLIDPNCFNDIAETITSEDFYLEDHARIYLAMQEMYLRSKSIDLVTLIDMLVKIGLYENIDRSKEYIKLVAEVVPTASNVKDYAQIVKDKSILRQLIAASDEISASAYGEQDEVKHIIDMAEQKIFAIAQGNETKGFVHIKTALLSVYSKLQALANNPEEVMGAPTGFSGLDRVLVGLGKGDLVLVGARPGMGKTAFAMNVAVSIAEKTKKAVAVFNLEMTTEQLASRMLSSEGLVDSNKLRTGNLSDEDWEKLAYAATKLSDCDILLDDTSNITVTGMKAKLRRVKNLGLVVVDYLGLMQSDRRIDNRVQEVAEISRNLKMLAKELGVPVIACAQLSRGPESRTDKRPMLSDLRDSGAIEQDADIVLFLYREEYYKDKAEPDLNTAEVIVAKNRHGSTSKVEMGWLGQFTKFIPIDTSRE